MSWATTELDTLWRHLHRLEQASDRAERHGEAPPALPRADDARPARRVASVQQALWHARPRLLEALAGSVSSIDCRPLVEALLPLCQDLALLWGGSALLNGPAGRRITSLQAAPLTLRTHEQARTWLQAETGVAAMDLQHGLPLALRHYLAGIEAAWGDTPTRSHPDALEAAWHIERGHTVLMGAMLGALAVGLSQGQADSPTDALQAIRHSRRLGRTVAEFVAAHEPELVRHLAHGASEGRITMASARPHDSGPALTPTQMARARASAGPAPGESPAPSPPRHWLEIMLLGDDGEPVPSERYSVRLPDGRLVTGQLDARGFARLADLPQGGACEVCFPDLDASAWQPIDAT